MKEEREEIRV